MLLMIDNYDSFTYNLVQYFAELGAEVEVRRNDQLTIADIEKLNPAQIVISPGPCTPNEAGVSLEVINHFAGKNPYWVSAWVIRRLARRLAAKWCMRGKSCMAKPHRYFIKTSASLKASIIHCKLPVITRWSLEKTVCPTVLRLLPGLKITTAVLMKSWACVIKRCRLKVCNSIRNRFSPSRATSF